MKRKLIISILLILIFIVSANICFADDDGVPSGTPISTAAQFFALSDSTGDYYLTDDIDISGYPNKQIAFFKGNLDGNGHSIKNYTINDQNGIFGNDRWYFASLFKESEGAAFKNLKFENINIDICVDKNYERVSVAIVGPADDMSLKNIQISGKISLQDSFDIDGVFVSALCSSSSYPHEMTTIQNSASINVELENCEVDVLEVSAFGRINPEQSNYSYSNLKNAGDITILADENSNISDFWISGVLRNGYGKRISLDSSSNEGKISVTNNGSKYANISISGISNDMHTLNKCYNSGNISFKGKASICRLSGLSVGSDNKITQCYNKGLIKASVTNRCKNTVELAGLNYKIKPVGNILNSYNAGNIYYSGNAKNKVKIAGITAHLEEDSNIKFCYNSGILKGSAKCEKAGISDSFTASKAFGNYFVAGKAVINGKSKNTQAKKVAAINKKNCPKLSADYWVYSSAKKRMVLKNNKES